MKVNELLKLLHKDGWLKKDQKGSHLQLINPVKPGKVTVPYHGRHTNWNFKFYSETGRT